MDMVWDTLSSSVLVKSACWNLSVLEYPVSEVSLPSRVVLYGAWLPLLAPITQTAVPLNVTEALAPNCVVRVNVPLWSYLGKRSKIGRSSVSARAREQVKVKPKEGMYSQLPGRVP